MSAPIQGIQNKLTHYATKGDVAAVSGIPASKMMGLFNCAAVNNSGGAAQVGVMKLLTNGAAKLYKLVSGVYSPLDLSVLDSGTLEIHTGDAGDGFAIGYREEIGMLGINISTTATGGDFTAQYSSDGSTFGALPAGSSIESPTDFSAAGKNYEVLQPPVDMMMGGPAGLDQSLFYINVISTGALSGIVEIDDLWIAKFLTLWNQVEDGQAASVSFDWKRPLILNGGEGVIPYFNIPNAANRVSTFYNVNG